MPLEVATYIEDLNSANPVGSVDLRSTGDDHLRLIKSAIKATFPGLAGRAWRTQAKAANYTVVLNDATSVINCTAALTLALTAAATLGNGHTFAVYASGGAVVVAPNGAETVNGSTTFTINTGTFAFVFCSGTEFFILGPQLSVNTYTQLLDGDGATVSFLLSSAPQSQAGTEVTINGIVQVPGVDYIVSGTELTFTTAPVVGTDNVFVRWSVVGTVSVVPGTETVVFTSLAPALLASQAEAEAGTVNTKLVTPLRVAQAIAALTPTAASKDYTTNTIGSALASLATFGSAGAWSAWVAVNATARINAIYGGSLANVRAITIYTKLQMQMAAGPVQQRSSVAFSGNNTDLQDNTRVQAIHIGVGGADSLRDVSFEEFTIPVGEAGGVINFYYSTRRQDSDSAAEAWSVYVTAVHLH